LSKLLLERRGGVVTRKELRALLSQPEDNADLSSSLNSAANRLRFTSAIRPGIPATSRPCLALDTASSLKCGRRNPADEVRAVTDAIEGLAQEEQTRILRAAAARLASATSSMSEVHRT
jgi:hypothetical protein